MAEKQANTGQSRYYRESQKKYYETHKPEIKVIMAVYYQKNKEKIKARRRERYKEEKARKKELSYKQ